MQPGKTDPTFAILYHKFTQTDYDTQRKKKNKNNLWYKWITEHHKKLINNKCKINNHAEY